MQKDVGPPTLIFEPYDIEAITGTTIEMPCQGEGFPKPEVDFVYSNVVSITPAQMKFFAGKMEKGWQIDYSISKTSNSTGR